MPSPISGLNVEGIHHAQSQKRWLYRRDRCSRLMPIVDATIEMLISTPLLRSRLTTSLTLASVAAVRALCVVYGPSRI